MSPRSSQKSTAQLHEYAAIFAALGDKTRLTLIMKLSAVQQSSISQLAKGSKLTRQAVTKHLRILENVGIVNCTRSGRENLFELDAAPFKSMSEYLGFVSEQWDQMMLRLKSFVEI